jgi:hypothetical protein
LDNVLKDAGIGQWEKSLHSNTGIKVYLSVENKVEADRIIQNALINNTQFPNINFYRK